MCSGINPDENAQTLRSLIADAVDKNADVLFTPEMTGLVDRDRKRASANISTEQDDRVLQEARAGAANYGLWINLGSLALRANDAPDGKWLNRSFLIDPTGNIVARYDKIHLFDVDLDTGESWRESSAYTGGNQAVVASMDEMKLGLSICYDIRFASLYTALTNAGANILTIPSAFTVPTGKAHWQTLLRARAIESAAFVVAATQCGAHQDGRATYGHSMVVDPWGDILLDMGTTLGVGICEIDCTRVAEVRQRVPVLNNRRPFQLPADHQDNKASE
jgi:predicted amidohydrolase